MLFENFYSFKIGIYRSEHRVQHAHSWKILKPHMINIIREIIFPIMQYSETDEDLYNNDTIEYIRQKFGN